LADNLAVVGHDDQNLGLLYAIASQNILYELDNRPVDVEWATLRGGHCGYNNSSIHVPANRSELGALDDY
jgi:hypothetical protein